jgi:hypothetical protein
METPPSKKAPSAAAAPLSKPAEPWIDAHPKEPPRPGTVPLPSEAGDPNWHGFSEVAPHVYVGAQLGTLHDDDAHLEADAAFLAARNFKAVLDMRQEGRDEGPFLKRHGLAYYHLSVLDHFAPTMAQLADAVRFIRSWADQGTNILVHCHVGHARSATAVMAYLIDRGRSLGQALGQLEAARSISVRWNHADLNALRDWAVHLGHPELATVDEALPPHALAPPTAPGAPGSGATA